MNLLLEYVNLVQENARQPIYGVDPIRLVQFCD